LNEHRRPTTATLTIKTKEQFSDTASESRSN
jgi:hypothetical protein